MRQHHQHVSSTVSDSKTCDASVLYLQAKRNAATAREWIENWRSGNVRYTAPQAATEAKDQQGGGGGSGGGGLFAGAAVKHGSVHAPSQRIPRC